MVDACDPDSDLGNLRDLIRLNTGKNIELTKDQICQVQKRIRAGRLPLPPMLLNRSKKVLTDGSTNLTGRDFERLFDGDTTLSHLQRIARKVDVKVDGKKKDDLIDEIKQKLKKEKVAEPVMISRKRIIQAEKLKEEDTGFFAVSYTHLTLPTILRV